MSRQRDSGPSTAAGAEPGRPTAERPWLALYRDGQPIDIAAEYENLLAMFAASVEGAPHQDAIRYFDKKISLAELDERSDALAAALQSDGFRPSDRLAIYAQNDPSFVVAMLATWKAGGIVVTANPMYKARELGFVLHDSEAVALLYLDELNEVVATVLAEPATSIRIAIAYSSFDDQSRNDPRLFSRSGTPPDSQQDSVPRSKELSAIVNSHRGQRPKLASLPSGTDTALLVYTSGTTGDPKGAELTHANLIFNARSFREWMELEQDEPILAIAPLFHITGLVGHAVTSLLIPAPLVLTHRFHPSVTLDAIREHDPVFTLPAITAFIALAGVEGIGPEDFRTLRKVYSGGAPIASAVVERFERDLGVYIRNAYGLTETASMTHAVPPGRRAPVDPTSGALSIGVPVASVQVYVVDDQGQMLRPGEIGELVIAGPQVSRGYWRRPDATATAFPGGALHTGDVGFLDPEGWFYLVDRKKDLIIAAGYKVWPREVEDVLYAHPAVREAAVIGVPDDYRGETVHAVVSLDTKAHATEAELIEFCRARMAAYKYPRSVDIVDDLPKTASGKILRRELRHREPERGDRPG